MKSKGTKRTSGSKVKRNDAEKAGEHWCREVMKCVMTRRPVRTQFQRIDFFCADVVGKMDDGTHVYAQVTTGAEQSARVRRRKLETIPWHMSDRVFLLQLRVDDETRPFKYYFRVHEYVLNFPADPRWDNSRTWQNSIREDSVPREWFKAYKEE